jgi:PAS domain S-box-containing protein
MADDGFLGLALDSAHNGIMAVDRAGYVRFFNRAAREILGLEEQPLVGRHHSEILPATWPQLREIMETGVARTGQQIQVRGRVLLANRAPIFSGGLVVGLVSVFVDLAAAERVLTELNAHKRLVQELEAIIESSHDGIYVTDGAARTLRVNRAYERVSGLSREALVGKPMQELVDAGFFDRSVTLEVLKTGEPVTIFQDIRGGKRVIVTGTPFRDPTTGEISLVVTNVRDITELDALRAELQRFQATSDYYSKELERVKLLNQLGLSLVARSPRILAAIDTAVQVARFNTTVLITGDSGVGKGVLAQLIHKMSPRKDGPFVKINCGSIPAHLLESELFGYEAGAFTGASARGKVGLFEVAGGGTLFLDEIGELPLELQVKLLQVLEDRALTRLGGIRRFPIDVRVLAATNRDLAGAVRERRFREDLYYRLQVVPIEVPPLRERRDDIVPLAQAFLSRFNSAYGKSVRLSPAALERLVECPFPGNVRELENLVERLVATAADDEPSLEAIPSAPRLSGLQGGGSGTLAQTLEDTERRMLAEALSRWGTTRAMAQQLGIDQSTVVRKLQKHGLRADAIMHR